MIETDKELRKKVKILKAIGQIDSFAEVAEILEINKKSFYNWLREEYNLGREKKTKLQTLIDDLWIPDII